MIDDNNKRRNKLQIYSGNKSKTNTNARLDPPANNLKRLPLADITSNQQQLFHNHPPSHQSQANSAQTITGFGGDSNYTLNNLNNRSKQTQILFPLSIKKAQELSPAKIQTLSIKEVQGPQIASMLSSLLLLSASIERKEESQFDTNEQGTNNEKVAQFIFDKNSQRQMGSSRGKVYRYLQRRPPPLDLKRIPKEYFKFRFPQEDFAGNILQPSQRMLNNQKQLNEDILSAEQANGRTKYLMNSIPLGTRMTFEVMIQDDSIFGSEYSFWLAGPQGKVLLMFCKKHRKLLQDYFIIYEYVEKLNCYSFIAKLQSDLFRQQFILSNETEYQENQNKQIYADINVYASQNKNAYAVYFPKFCKMLNHQIIVKGYQDQNILQQLSSKTEFIECLAPCQVLPSVEKSFIDQEGLIPWEKSVSMSDREGRLKYFIGKVESQKYRIYVGSGVSPLIVFAMFIVLYES